MIDDDEEEVLPQPTIPELYFPQIEFNVPTIPPKPVSTGTKCVECAAGVGEPYRSSEERNVSIMTSYQINVFFNPQRGAEVGLKTGYELDVESS